MISCDIARACSIPWFCSRRFEKSQEKTHDSYIKQLQESIQEIKVSREMGVRYVLFLEKLEEEYRDGYEAGERSGYEKGEKIGYDHGEKMQESLSYAVFYLKRVR